MRNGKIIINFCPTGMVPTKDMTPFVPVSPQEIIEQTHEAYEIGITIAHLHARQDDGIPTYKKNIYRDIFEGVRKHCPDLIICGSTSGRNFPEFEKRSEVIELKPDMCSLTLSSLNFVKQASVNAPDMVQRLAEKMKDYGVTTELECFDLGMINYGKYLIKKGLIEGPFYWNLLFGNIAGFQASFQQIGTALAEIPETHYIGLAGLAADQLTVNSAAIGMGYGVRVGLEDNIWWDENRSRHSTNIELVKRVHSLIEIHGKKCYSPKEFGKLGFRNEAN
ncbi:3-keto-5-aminohexanoate cleavage protein [Marinifilum caeruleilacunae]|uniref:3-keto-5-aminohexanoate cleavage protein n=1 Tax=Marinifilum caeruleilacunae TaxID=2499076 RepID=A0ABX1WQV1_9BACT|nr:3-keto-5-aminohexanoate cleavage protein [Marinifilum caeruleilacunae]NOU58465.1 3-keto-5-aminohexanoate cleavage protein [Marinifilum caeruleilacunae]